MIHLIDGLSVTYCQINWTPEITAVIVKESKVRFLAQFQRLFCDECVKGWASAGK